MDNLYIKIQEGIPQDHPVTASNLIQVFGHIPDNYVKFTRLSAPEVSETQIAEHKGYIYDPDQDSFVDFWVVTDKIVE